MGRDAGFLKGWVGSSLLIGACAAALFAWWYQHRIEGRPKAIATVGILNPNPAWEPTIQGVKSAMASFGYREAETVRYVYAGPLPEVEAVDAEARRLVRARVDLLLSVTTPATLAAKRAAAGTKIPLVFAPVSNAIDSGLVPTLRSSRGNLTGINAGVSTAKALEWLTALGRKVSTVLVLHDPDDKSSGTALEDLKRAAAKLHIALTVFPYTRDAAAPGALDAKLGKVDAVFLLPASRWVRSVSEVAEAAVRRKIPLAATSPVENRGALLVYGADPFLVGTQAGRLAAQVLRGVPPADLPVETSEFTLRLNLRTARAIGLEVPEPLVLKASRVVR